MSGYPEKDSEDYVEPKRMGLSREERLKHSYTGRDCDEHKLNCIALQRAKPEKALHTLSKNAPAMKTHNTHEE